jgi:uncharacterized protein (TIGR02266 family)
MAMTERILVVDNDMAALGLILEAVRSQEMIAIPVTDSEQALSMTNLVKFDGIFLNLSMPQLDGFRFLQALRHSRWNQTTPVVIMAASVERSTLKEAFRAGGNFMLQKPLTRPSLNLCLRVAKHAMSEDRRKLVRVPLDVEVQCTSAGTSFLATSRNISERGMLMQGNEAMKPGTVVRLELRLPGQREYIRCTGVVARIDNDNQMGISFNHIRDTDKQRIRIYIGKNQEAFAVATSNLMEGLGDVLRNAVAI